MKGVQAGSLLASYIPPSNPLPPDALSALHGQLVTLVGFGSLLSETSSRTTFPTVSSNTPSHHHCFVSSLSGTDEGASIC